MCSSCATTGLCQTTHGSTVTITDELPKGVTATEVTAVGEGANGMGSPRYELACEAAPGTALVDLHL